MNRLDTEIDPVLWSSSIIVQNGFRITVRAFRILRVNQGFLQWCPFHRRLTFHLSKETLVTEVFGSSKTSRVGHCSRLWVSCECWHVCVP